MTLKTKQRLLEGLFGLITLGAIGEFAVFWFLFVLATASLPSDEIIAGYSSRHVYGFAGIAFAAMSY